jgi:26S proteasome regulatory subunit N3
MTLKRLLFTRPNLISKVGKLAAQNRRSLDQIAARCYYYHTLSHEAVGRLDKIRDFLHGRLRTATLSVSFKI